MATMEDYEPEYDEDDYFYLEDTFIEADYLAEHAVASPVLYEGDDDIDPDHWRYEYWNDIEYDSDGDAVRDRQTNAAKAGQKRTKGTGEAKTPRKRRKVLPGAAHATDDSPAVLLVHQLADEVMKSPSSRKTATPAKPWALLKDWRERLENAPVFAAKNKNVRLAEVVDEPEDDDEEEELMMGGEEGNILKEEEDDNGIEQSDLGASVLDPEILKMALRQKLAASGLTGMDEEMLMQFAARMFANEAEADDIAGELAGELLEKEGEEEEEGADGGLSEWVSQQVQTSQATEGGEQQPLTPVDTTSEALRLEATPVERRPPTPASTATSSSADTTSPNVKSKPVPAISPRGSKRKATQNEEGHPPRKVSRALSPKPANSTVLGKKRKADPEEDSQSPKRPARSFDAPTAASKSRSVSAAAVPPKTTRKGRK